MKILVTDGHLKSALSAARDLAAHGCEVHTTQSRAGPTCCSLSRCTVASHVLPAYDRADEYDARLLELLQRECFDYLLPCSDDVVRRMSARREKIATLTRLDLPPRESLDIIFSRTTLACFAERLGIRCPATVGFGSPDMIGRAANLGFPLVAKWAGYETYDRVEYLNSAEDLRAFLKKAPRLKDVHFQEYVAGTGHGCFMLFENGGPVLRQMHERVWEFPSTGGPSVYARTFDDPRLLELGTCLLTALEWNGLAMVEFKRSREDGDYRLMEVNPRLWGSLDLSLAAGADFPFAAIQRDRRACAAAPLRKASFIWVVPDAGLHVVSRPAHFFPLLKLLFTRGVRTNVRLDDPRPLLRQAREMLYWLKTLFRMKRLRSPHGRPVRVAARNSRMSRRSALSLLCLHATGRERTAVRRG